MRTAMQAEMALPIHTTYTTLDGDVLDLTGLDESERAYFQRCYQAYRADMPWVQFTALSVGPEHPLLREARGRITRAVRDHLLYRAVRDLEDRLGIKQGEVGAGPGDDVSQDPVVDDWIPAATAAREKGVSLPGLHKAMERGAVIGRPAKPGGTHLVVSANSLRRWTPDPVRRAARQAS